MSVKMRLVIAAFVALIVGAAVRYIAGTKSRNAELERLLRSLAIAQSAKETAFCTRLLEGLRGGKTDLVTDRLETMLDYSVIHIGIMTEFCAPPHDVDEAVSRSLCLARNYRTLYPHRPSEDWAAKRLDAALSLKSERE